MPLDAWPIFVVAETPLCLAPERVVRMSVSIGLVRDVRASAAAGSGIATIRESG